MAATAYSSATGGEAHAAVHCRVTLARGSQRLADLDGRARLDWIDARLSKAGHQARVWAWVWGVGIGASGLASLAVVPFVRPQDRIDWYTSAGSAAIGVVPFLVSPLDVASDSQVLHAALATKVLGESEDAVCALLLDAEQRMVHDAENQRRQQSRWLHAGNMAFNTGVTLFLGLGFHHWTSGIINGVAGAAVGEAIILTQPTRTIDDLETYRAGALDSGR